MVPDIKTLPAQITIQGQDAKHITKVLRLCSGDPLNITDGRGKDYLARIVSVSKDTVQADILSSLDSNTESPLKITLCSGMLKDKKMDFIIKHVTQLGIYKWIPFFCERSIPSPDSKKIEKRWRRWQTIAKESLKQCRRSRLPDITEPVDFETLLELSDTCDRKIAFWEKSTQRLDALNSLPPAKNVMILIGPEGGFSETEIQFTQAKGFSSYLMGPRILRAETASICACTLIQHILGDI